MLLDLAIAEPLARKLRVPLLEIVLKSLAHSGGSTALFFPSCLRHHSLLANQGLTLGQLMEQSLGPQHLNCSMFASSAKLSDLGRFLETRLLNQALMLL